ncbi:MAG TPA: RNA 2',3'-cyclic phosphodiesterase [Myxococcaceae bacterium]|nr:RNA 2',3'-cyclic phosphodiesterase [Myxococcaceae bacterium]
MGWRLFVAVDLGAKVRRALEALQSELSTLAPRARWGPPSNAHLTLAFLGSMEEAKVPELSRALEGVATRAAPFDLQLRGGGAFGSPKKPRVLWVGVEGDTARLHQLQAWTGSALQPLGYEPEERDYRPHLTLARARDPRGDPGLARCAGALADRALGAARVDRLILFRSQPGPGGSKYTPLAEPPLSG